MSKRSKFANEPLMYIHQPSQSKPNAPMQNFYTTPKKSKAPAPTPEAEKKTEQAPIKRRPPLSPIQHEVAEKPQSKPKPRRKSSHSHVEETKEEKSAELHSSLDQKEQDNKKKFKDMTIPEKIDYFMNPSSHLPKMRCEVITEERKYRGIILDLEDNEVRMRVGRRSVFINQEDIKEIQLLGLGF